MSILCPVEPIRPWRMATESSLSNVGAAPTGGEIQLTTVKAKVALVGAEYTGDDAYERFFGLFPLTLFARHYAGPKYRVDLVVWNVIRPGPPWFMDCVPNGVRGLFIFRNPSSPVPDYVADLGRRLPVVVGLDAEQGLVLLANHILRRAVGVVRSLPSRGE